MGFAYRRRGRVFRSWCFCSAGQKGLDWLVYAIWRFQPGDCNAVAYVYWGNRYRIGDSYFNKTDSACAFVDGVLGFLDRAFASFGRHAGLGFYGTLGKLGSPVSFTSFNWPAKVVARMVKVGW